MNNKEISPTHPTDLHTIGRLLHLLSEGIGFGPGWCFFIGQSRRFRWLVPPTVQRREWHRQCMCATSEDSLHDSDHYHIHMSTHLWDILVFLTVCGPNPCPVPVWLNVSFAFECWEFQSLQNHEENKQRNTVYIKCLNIINMCRFVMDSVTALTHAHLSECVQRINDISLCLKLKEQKFLSESVLRLSTDLQHLPANTHTFTVRDHEWFKMIFLHLKYFFLTKLSLKRYVTNVNVNTT